MIFAPTRGAAGNTKREQRGLGARIGEPHALGTWKEPLDLGTPFQLQLVRCAVVGSPSELVLDGLDHDGSIVTEQQRTVTHPVVDEALALDCPFVSAFGPVDINRRGVEVATIVQSRRRGKPGLPGGNGPATVETARRRLRRARRRAAASRPYVVSQTWFGAGSVPAGGEMDRGPAPHEDTPFLDRAQNPFL